MPANSGALTGTIAHSHSALSADGGFLGDGVTGVTGAANGSLLFFDGSSIAQDLPAGNLNDVLTMGAAVPAWSASIPPTSNYEFLGSDTGVATTSLSLNFTAVEPPDYCVCVFSGTCTAAQGNDWRTNTLSAGYDYQGSYFSGGAQTFLNTTGSDKIYAALSSIAGVGFLVNMKVFVNPLTDNLYYQTESYSDANGFSSVAGRNSTAAQTSITDIEIRGTAFSGTLSVWAVRN